MNKKLKLIFFIGYHNSGKTTLVERVAKRLT
jgi:molybdopterin-guanine dinucleotide biosynthesis protein